MDITNLANLPNPEAAIFETKNIGIEGTTRAESVRAIVGALRAKPGVKEVRVDVESGIASVTFDTSETNFPEIHDTLLTSGYRPTRTVRE